MKQDLQEAGLITLISHLKTARYGQFLQIILRILLRQFQEGK